MTVGLAELFDVLLLGNIAGRLRGWQLDYVVFTTGHKGCKNKAAVNRCKFLYNLAQLINMNIQTNLYRLHTLYIH